MVKFRCNPSPSSKFISKKEPFKNEDITNESNVKLVIKILEQRPIETSQGVPDDTYHSLCHHLEWKYGGGLGHH